MKSVGRGGWIGIALAVGFALVAVRTANAKDPAGTVREQSDQVLDAAGLRVIEVSNTRGLISVRPSADGKVRLSALKIVRGGTSRKTQELSEATSVEARVEGDRYVVRVRYPQRIHIGFWDLVSGDDFPRVEVRIALDVPPGMELNLKSVSADISTDGMKGTQRLASTSGDIGVGEAAGWLTAVTVSGDVDIDRLARGEAITTSGDIRIGNAGGALRAGTTSGDIEIEEAADSLRVSTTSGDVNVVRARRGAEVHSISGTVEMRAAGRVSGESASGDLSVVLESPFAGANLSTISGGLTTRLARDVGCALDVHTVSGTISIDVPLSEQSVSRRHVSGRVGKGAANCVLKSTSGDIHVE